MFGCVERRTVWSAVPFTRAGLAVRLVALVATRLAIPTTAPRPLCPLCRSGLGTICLLYQAVAITITKTAQNEAMVSRFMARWASDTEQTLVMRGPVHSASAFLNDLTEQVAPA